MSNFCKAEKLIREFKGENYIFGEGTLDKTGEVTNGLGKRAALIWSDFPGVDELVRIVKGSLFEEGVKLLGEIEGPAPNAPRKDLHRMTEELRTLQPEVTVCLGGGSTIDATKAAEVLRTLGGSIDDYFGVGRVSDKLLKTSKVLKPVVAIQTASSSAAHLTKYSNITDISTGQKKLIVDDAIVPEKAFFDYGVTRTMSPGFTADGGLDGLAHVLEVLYSSVGKPHYIKMMEVAGVAIHLIVTYLEQAVKHPDDLVARKALGLATDLGGFAIMLGGTNGAHLTSFSLVDLLSHGRACGIMNPYYTVFFAPAIEEPLCMVGKIFHQADLTDADIEAFSGRALGVVVAEAMIALNKRIGAPYRLEDVDGFSDKYIDRALVAAKDPQLRMKLENMPVPLISTMVEQYIKSVLMAAKTGDLRLIQNVV